MREKLIETLGLDADATDAEIVAAVQQLMRFTNSPGAKAEKAIREKMNAGLSRNDAIQVLKDQETDDELRDEREAAAEEARRAEEAKRKQAAASTKTEGSDK